MPKAKAPDFYEPDMDESPIVTEEELQALVSVLHFARRLHSEECIAAKYTVNFGECVDQPILSRF